MPPSEQFFLWVSFLLLLCDKSLAINCYQCSGTNPGMHPFQCNEWLSSDSNIEPEPCDNVYGAQYCIKHTGRFEGGIGTKRFCSSLNLGNYCNYVRQPGDQLTYRTCVFTCSGDACNPGSMNIPKETVLYFTSIVVLVLYYNR